IPAASAGLGTALFAAIGFIGSSYAVIMAHGRALLPARVVGRGVTLMNFTAMGGAGLAQIATGELAALYGAADPAQGYAAVFAFYAATLGVACLVYLASRDAPPRG
ncbi:MAG: MFS transporter, partial [Pseudomonadota bacterium]